MIPVLLNGLQIDFLKAALAHALKDEGVPPPTKIFVEKLIAQLDQAKKGLGEVIAEVAKQEEEKRNVDKG